MAILSLSLGVSAQKKQTKKTTTTIKTLGKQQHQLDGQATFYGDHYSSRRRTASGERFDKKKLTAAHKTLPFGTYVRVTNLKNNKSVIVKINDRGNMPGNRIIDVSSEAANQLVMRKAGVVPVKLEIIEMPLPKKENS